MFAVFGFRKARVLPQPISSKLNLSIQGSYFQSTCKAVAAAEQLTSVSRLTTTCVPASILFSLVAILEVDFAVVIFLVLAQKDDISFLISALLARMLQSLTRDAHYISRGLPR